MGLIPDSEIERLKREVRVEELARGRGVELVRHGADLIGRCPFHNDRTPSLVITPAKNLWHCLGACGEGGDALQWVMKAEGVSFRHAVELLRDGGRGSGAGGRQNNATPPRKSTVPKLASPVEAEAEDEDLLGQVVEYYHATLKEKYAPQQYLQQRGLDHSGLITEFKLGYSNRTLGYRLPASNRVAGADLRGRLERLGILRESGHEHFNGALVVPVLDPAGRVRQMYGRKITPGLKPNLARHLYLPGPQRGVWS